MATAPSSSSLSSHQTLSRTTDASGKNAVIKTSGEQVRNAATQNDDVEEDTERDTAYFQYYALLSHQAQMLQDSVRTSTYQKAISAHAERCFRDKDVIDVGAGNGILSIFAAQSGARKVFAIEASNMVERLQHFVNAAATGNPDAVNTWLADRVKPVHSKMEDVSPYTLDGTKQVDTIVSECLGVLLVHERMCESFLDARDRFLKPGGAMLPSSGTICLSLIEDKPVWEEAANKARFWSNRNFYGVDITPFSEAAWEEAFSSPVVGCFGPLIVLTTSNDYQIDFQTITQEELRCFTIPLSFDMTQTSVVHGLGGWFDLHFLPPASPEAAAQDLEMTAAHSAAPSGDAFSSSASAPAPASTTFDMPDLSAIPDFTAAANAFVGDATAMDPSISSTYMSTSPFSTSTHWQQVRFLLREPLAVNKGQRIVGSMECRVNQFRSYTLTATLQIEGSTDVHSKRQAQWRLDRQVYSWTSAAPAPQ